VHCFGRIKDVPWYYNPIFQTVVGILMCAVIGYFFFIKSPSPEKQNQILTAVTNSSAKEDDVLAIVKRMEAVQNENTANLSNDFPLGYILFTATERKQIIPLRSPMDKVIQFDWENSNYSVDMNEQGVFLHLPDFTLQNPDGTGTAYFKGASEWLPRAVGAKHYGYVLKGNLCFVFEVISTNTDSVIMAMGLQHTPTDVQNMINQLVH
jgi:hypothetical protein